jgi:hypothetical protein
MKKRLFTSDPKTERLQRIEAELGQDMLEKLSKAFVALAEAMVRRAVRKAEAELQDTGK